MGVSFFRVWAGMYPPGDFLYSKTITKTSRRFIQSFFSEFFLRVKDRLPKPLMMAM